MSDEQVPRDIALISALKPYVGPQAQNLIDALLSVVNKHTENTSSQSIDAKNLSQDIKETLQDHLNSVLSLALLMIPFHLSKKTTASKPVPPLKNAEEPMDGTRPDGLDYF